MILLNHSENENGKSIRGKKNENEKKSEEIMCVLHMNQIISMRAYGRIFEFFCFLF